MPTNLTEYQPISRSSLFYSKWQWCMVLYVPDGHLLRDLDQKKFENIIQRRANWGGHKISDDSTKYLNQVRLFLQAITVPHLRYTTYDHFYIYTNSTTLLDQIEDCMDQIEDCKLFHVQFRRRAQVDQPQGVLVRQDPQHKTRTFFQDRMITPDQSTQLISFFKSRRDLRVSRSLLSTLNRPQFNWVRRYHWFDHDHPGECTFLSMICPGIVRQSMPIQAK